MSDPHDRIKSITNKGKNMFIYLVHLTTGGFVRVETAGDPTDHPSFHGRVSSVITLGESGKHLHMV